MLGRATFALVLGLAVLPACNREAPADAAVAGAGTGIPMGAVGAVGVSFDTPPPPPGEATPPLRRKLSGKRRQLPPDPFADPPDTPGDHPTDGGSVHPPGGRRSGGTDL